MLNKEIDITASIPLDGFRGQWRQKFCHSFREFFIAELQPRFEKRRLARAVVQIRHHHRISFGTNPCRHAPL
jgi:hypothetical protein